MSSVIPPLLSNTPPPPPSPEEDDDDEFGDFTGANDYSYGCDNLSLPPSPDQSPKKVSISNGLNVNSKAEKNKGTEKDFQDKRKVEESLSDECSPIEVGCLEDVHKRNSFFELSLENSEIILNENKSEIYSKNLQLIDDQNIKNKLEKKDDVEVSVTNKSNQNTYVQKTLNENIANDINEANIGFILEDHVTECSSIPIGNNVETKKPIFVNGRISPNEHLEEKVPSRRNNSEESKEDFKDVKNLENKSNQIETISLLSEVKSYEKSVDGFSEFCLVKEIDDISTTENIFENDDPPNYKEKIKGKAQASKINKKEAVDTFQEQFIEGGAALTTNVLEKQEGCADDGFSDFADFKFADDENSDGTEAKLKTTSSDTNDDFGDFSSHRALEVDLGQNIVNPINNDELEDDFGEFASTIIVEDSKERNVQFSNQNDDEFGNFADFTEVVQDPVVLMLNEKQAFEKAETILREIFPVFSEIHEDFHYVNFEKDDFIFNELKDITETQALTYQWSKSASQNLLLNALSIDARNILYGPPWNPSMPRFAANLGLKPLEPIKTEILTPSVLKSSPSSQPVQSANVEIPNAQFDWSGSGLVNPLDSKASAESSSPTDITRKPLELSLEPSLILQPKPVSLQEVSTKATSKTDLEQKIDSPDQQFDDFEDFTSYQPPSESQASNWSSVVPLRETYISNDSIPSNCISNEIPLDIESWLQPTIVTPELPRKDLSIEEEELPDIHTPELTRKIVPGDEFENEFDDFQMVLPNSRAIHTISESIIGNDKLVLSDALKPIKSEIKGPNLIASTSKDATFSDFSLFEEKSEGRTQEMLHLKPQKTDEKAILNEDDEFTDFHSSVPISQPITPKPLTPILEPLKPVPAYPTMTPTSAQINWPDPGITDEEIKKLEMVFSNPQELKTEEQKNLKEETNKSAVEVSLDDDEWSDFVSVQKPSPVHKFQANERERTSSPDLPLSVLNLGSVQPAKAPIPVITPQGLVQTKLSSNNMVNMSPKMQLKSIPFNAPNKSVYQQPLSQPSIISNQFASQAYNFNNYMNQNSKKELVKSPDIVNQASLDDDDWSDFVSSPLPQPTANGYQQNWHNMSSQMHTGWTNASPNIIMNPGHFVQSGSDVKSKKVSNTSVNSKKSTIPSISLPDLEFIAPKGRTSSSRRK